MPLLFALTTFLQQSSSPSLPTSPTGLEWMPVASIIVPAVLLLVLVWWGQRSRV